MKYVLVLGDGMADYPNEKLNGKTPLSAARTPYMDMLATTGKIGLVKTVPDGFKPGSDVANLGALGYDAAECYTGRSPLEALSIGIDMADDDVAVRTNLVTLSDEEDFCKKRMLDYSSGEITTAEARELIDALKEHIDDDKFTLYPGVSYRHCLIMRHSTPAEELTPPHDITGKIIGEYMPKGRMGDKFGEMIKLTYEVLKNHPINRKRVLNGQKPANSIWFWGEGTKPRLQNFRSRYGLKGGMISAVDLLKGIAIGAGMKSVDVEGATGTLSTNFKGKADAVCKLLDEGADFVFVHLEAPDECGHQGDLEGKIKAIEIIDEKIIGAVFERLKAKGEPFAMLIMPDHYTPLSILTHSAEPVPFLMYSSARTLGKNAEYNERSAAESGIYYDKPRKLTEDFFALGKGRSEP